MIHTTRTSTLRYVVLALSVASILVLAAVPSGFAAKGGNGGGGGGKPAGATGSFSLVLFDSNANGVPNWGESVTFNVTSTASYPMVNLKCYQGGDWVTNQTVGFYPGWPWSRDFPLSSWKWTGGAAECDAVLYYQTNKGNQTLASMSFHVDA